MWSLSLPKPLLALKPLALYVRRGRPRPRRPTVFLCVPSCTFVSFVVNEVENPYRTRITLRQRANNQKLPIPPSPSSQTKPCAFPPSAASLRIPLLSSDLANGTSNRASVLPKSSASRVRPPCEPSPAAIPPAERPR